MKMTTTKPTMEGFYWAEDNYGELTIIQLVLREGGARARIIGSYFTVPLERWVRWSARLTEPEVE